MMCSFLPRSGLELQPCLAVAFHICNYRHTGENQSRSSALQLESRLVLAMLIAHFEVSPGPTLPYTSAQQLAEACHSGLHTWHRGGVELHMKPRAST